MNGAIIPAPRRRFNWPKALALGIDLILLYLFSFDFWGPMMAGAHAINAVDHLMSDQTARSLLTANAVSVALEGARIGGETFVVISVAYYLFLRKTKRRSLGRVVVDHFTTTTETDALR
jgi:hypothetical protein